MIGPDSAFHCHFGASTSAVREALIETHDALSSRGIEQDMTETVQIVLAEVLNNVVEHAYGEVEGGPIEMTIWLEPEGLHCEVRDCGIAMPNDELPSGAFPEIDKNNRDSLPEGGFGWAMVLTMVASIAYQREGGMNRLRFQITHP
ncbi:ATP-binding protein [Gymnodinialimonas sp. 2305UL16-5]|uniref:ATP-binding protein n=1 Tax=Gymnodinialimonas mytili TaxID=3126503 RepID=UPI00309D0B19